MSDFSILCLLVGMALVLGWAITRHADWYYENHSKDEPKQKRKSISKVMGDLPTPPTRYEYTHTGEPFPATPLYETDAWNYMSEDEKREYVKTLWTPAMIIQPKRDEPPFDVEQWKRSMGFIRGEGHK